MKPKTNSLPSGNDRYRWVALSNTTLGLLISTINSSILLISIPDIFRGIHLDPLAPGNTAYFLWTLMGFMLVTSVLVVSFGRIGDMYGRVRMYTMGFAIFTVFSILLAATWLTGPAGAIWIIVMRLGQGVGGAFLFANSSAILTDAFPAEQRGFALGINSVAAIGGSFLGLIIGGFLSPIEWRLVFLVSVPIGVFGTAWAYLRLRDNGRRVRAKVDWIGNVSFALSLVLILTGIVYGLQPYGHQAMGWSNPKVILAIAGGIAILIAFIIYELRIDEPMFHMDLFKNRAFAMGNASALLLGLARGGLQFMLIVWLQGIWLPLHGYSFSQTPLWAGIYLVPLTIGFIASGPLAGRLADRYGARPFATMGLVLTGLSLIGLQMIPINFNYWLFAFILFISGVGVGLFPAANTSSVMNTLPVDQRGAGGGMLNTLQNSAMVLSIGLFFTFITIGLASSLPSTLYRGLTAEGVPRMIALHISHLSPLGSLFAAFLGINPMTQLLGPHVLAVPGVNASVLTSNTVFPQLISQPFAAGLRFAFILAALICFIAAICSWLRGPTPRRGALRSMANDLEAGLGGAAEADMAGLGSAIPADLLEPPSDS